MNNARFDKITGIPNIPISYGIRLVENFPKIDENKDGKIIDIIAKETKNMVTIPIRLEIFDIE
tara:strand:+ start:347 stop:535 length:189 start_codon:yes stop_codon:yes gene_type:complete